MTVKEANILLKTAKTGKCPSKLNPSFTQNQAIEIIRKGLVSYGERRGEDFILPDLFEKRVYQITRNQRRPRY